MSNIYKDLKEKIIEYHQYFIYSSRVQDGINLDLCDYTVYGSPYGAYQKGGFNYSIYPKDRIKLSEIYYTSKGIKCALLNFDTSTYDYILLRELSEENLTKLNDNLNLMIKNNHLIKYSYSKVICCKGVVEYRILERELLNRGFIRVNYYTKVRGKIYIKIDRNGFILQDYPFIDNYINFGKGCLDSLIIKEDYTHTHEYDNLK